MTRVLASGVFDLLHDGHHYYLAQAAALGDHLTVIVASDAEATRHKRPPAHSMQQRVAAVAALEHVDQALPGREPYDLLGTVTATQPDIIALGYDQRFEVAELERLLEKHGFAVQVQRLAKKPGEHISTSVLRENR